MLRAQLPKATLSQFEKEAGLKVVSAVEQEFQVLGADWPAAPPSACAPSAAPNPSDAC